MLDVGVMLDVSVMLDVRPPSVATTSAVADADDAAVLLLLEDAPSAPTHVAVARRDGECECEPQSDSTRRPRNVSAASAAAGSATSQRLVASLMPLE